MNEESTSYRPPKWIATRKVYFNKDLRYQLVGDAERLLYEVGDRTTIRMNYHLMEDAFACLLANLLHADVIDAPLVYSRNSNAYVIERKRYCYGFYTYKMIVRLVDAMYEMGLVSGVKGRQYATGRCRSSKMWATDELLNLIYPSIDAVFIKPNEEKLYLKDAEKRLIDYRETKYTRAMRNRINELNEMLESLNVEFEFNYSDQSNKHRARISKFYKFVSLLFSNQVQVISDSVPVSRLLNVREHRGLLTKYYSVLEHDAILK